MVSEELAGLSLRGLSRGLGVVVDISVVRLS